MNSNIEFKSNVYPISDDYYPDCQYLSQIYEFNKLKSINEHFYQGRSDGIWNENQKKIISEMPICSIDIYPDPCWGMVKDGNNFYWKCKCLNTRCKHFSTCRPKVDINDIDNEIKKFSPKYNALKGYSYDFSEYIFKIFPVLFSSEEYFYGDFNRHKKNIVEKSGDSQAYEAIPKIEIMAALGNLEEKENEESSDISEKIVSEEEQKKEGLLGETITNLIETSEPEVLPINIFERFENCEQDDIISASSREVLFIDAGPGTGKTYTLIQRINHMVTKEAVEPEGILVLCFTNAAVDEIKARLKSYIEDGADRGLANVDIRTFHSFSWWLIGQANELFIADGWQKIQLMGLSYDQSIKIASNIISKFKSQIFKEWKHFIVDEVQDLTNDLARLVLQIVNGCLNAQCGITLFGDSCQAIYDYTQDNNDDSMTSEGFYNALFYQLERQGKFFKLIHNFRQSNDLISMTSDLRNSILTKDVTDMKDATLKLMNNIKPLDKSGLNITLKDLNSLSNTGKTCLLLRNNGQTLKLSSIFRKRGIPHSLNVAETNRNYAPWIADVFHDYLDPQISYDTFKNRYNKYVTDSTLKADTIWKRLQDLLNTESEVLSVKKLLNSICYSKIDDSILRSTHYDNILVSNIHRAKGREYECVILNQSFGEALAKKENRSDEYKTMYVAVTRPKNVLIRAPLQPEKELYPITIFATNRKRWGRAKKGKIINLEFISGIDINPDEFALINQKDISKVAIGDEISLKRNLTNNSINYQIIHENSDATLGKTLDSYIEDIRKYMRIPLSMPELINMPSKITDLYVNGIYSQIVDEEYLKLHPEIASYVPTGVWKWIEIIGAGYFDYDVY